MGLLHILYATAAYIYISGTYTNVRAAFVYATTSYLLYAHAAFTYGAPAFMYSFMMYVQFVLILTQMAPHTRIHIARHFQST